jgi:hypothetical protein
MEKDADLVSRITELETENKYLKESHGENEFFKIVVCE